MIRHYKWTLFHVHFFFKPNVSCLPFCLRANNILSSTTGPRFCRTSASTLTNRLDTVVEKKVVMIPADANNGKKEHEEVEKYQDLKAGTDVEG